MAKEKGYFLLVIALFSTIFLTIFNSTLTNIASPYIVSDLGGDNFISKYTISFFNLGNVLSIPLGPRLYERLGKRSLMLGCLILFALSSLGCALALNFTAFILFRVLQGVSTGPFFSLVNQLYSQIACEAHKKLFPPIVLAIFVAVPALGACFGGWIAYDYIWQLNFYFNIPFILLLIIYLGYRLREFDTPTAFHPFNSVGYVFYSVGLFCLGSAIITGQELDWHRSPTIIALTVIGTIALLFYIFWDLRHAHPILNLRLFKRPIFNYSLINLGVLFGTYYGMVILLALWLTLYVNYTPIWLGVLIGNMAIAALLPLFFFYKLFGRFDPRTMLFVALVLFAISNFYSTTFNVEVNLGRVAISRILAGFAIAFFLPPVFRLSFTAFSNEKSTEVLLIFQVVRALCSGIGTAIFVTMWQRRLVFFHERLGEDLTAFSQPTEEFFGKANQLSVQGQPALELLNQTLDRQATSLALNDCFYFMGWTMIALIALMGLVSLFKEAFVFPTTSKNKPLA